MIKLVHENGNLKEAYNDMREAYRKIENNVPMLKENQIQKAELEVEIIEAQSVQPASIAIKTKKDGIEALIEEKEVKIADEAKCADIELAKLKEKLEKEVRSEKLQQMFIIFCAFILLLWNCYYKLI